jgi:hypothetical protein
LGLRNEPNSMENRQMRTIALFIDDAATARMALQPLIQSRESGRLVLVACAPKLSRHVGRFVSNAGREQYRQRWARVLFAELQPLWSTAPRGTVETVIATAPLEVIVQRMKVHEGTQLVAIDARRAALEQAGAGQSTPAQVAAQRWLIPAFVTTGLGIALAISE